MEAELVERAALPYATVQGGQVVGLAPHRALLGLARLAFGALQALGLTGRFHPDVVFATGGYSAFAVALAAWLRRIPVAVYLPDIEPGTGVRIVSRFSRKILVTAQESARFFTGRQVTVTGYPVRPELLSATREAAHTHFGLSPDRPTLLVFGGSRGARSLNNAIFAGLDHLLRDYQVIHITGTLDWPAVDAHQQALPDATRRHYHAFAYLHDDMGLAFAAADLAVARAGASTLGELPAFGLPAILVPYPHAWRYQKVNADTLAARGAAIRLDDEHLGEELIPLIDSLFAAPERLHNMRAAARSAAIPDAASRIAAELRQLAGEPTNA